jgi:hypothetical protein
MDELGSIDELLPKLAPPAPEWFDKTGIPTGFAKRLAEPVAYTVTRLVSAAPPWFSPGFVEQIVHNPHDRALC